MKIISKSPLSARTLPVCVTDPEGPLLWSVAWPEGSIVTVPEYVSPLSLVREYCHRPVSCETCATAPEMANAAMVAAAVAAINVFALRIVFPELPFSPTQSSITIAGRLYQGGWLFSDDNILSRGKIGQLLDCVCLVFDSVVSAAALGVIHRAGCRVEQPNFGNGETRRLKRYARRR